MQNRKKRLNPLGSLRVRTAVTAVLLCCLGCGASAERTSQPAPPIDENLLDLAPSSPNAVIAIDMNKVRASMLFSELETLFRDQSKAVFQGNDGADGIDPIRDIDEILIVSKSTGQNGELHFLILIKGRFSSKAVLSVYAKNEKGILEGATPVEIDGFPGFRGQESTAIAITDRTLALTTGTMTTQVTRRARGDGQSLRSDPDFEDFLVGGKYAAQLRYRRGNVTPNFSKYNPLPPRIDLDAITGLDAALFLETGLKIEISTICDTQMDASQIASTLNQMKRRLKKNMLVKLLGVGWVLDRVVINSDHTTITTQVDLNTEDLGEIKQLVERLNKLKDLLSGESGNSGPPLQMPPRPSMEKKQ